VNSNPTVADILALLDSLRSAVRDFAAREETLASEFRVRTAAETRNFETASAAQTDESATAASNAEAAFAAAGAHAESRFASRKSWLNRAHINARKNVMDDITEKEGQQRYRVQEGTLNAEKRREAELARAAGVLEEFNHRAAETRDALLQLGSSARQSFGGYRKFQKLLAWDRQWPGTELSADENSLQEEAEKLRESAAANLARFRRRIVPQLFRCLPLWLFGLVLLGFAVAVPILLYLGIQAFTSFHTAIAAGGFVLVLALYLIGKSQASPAAGSIAADIAKASRMLETAFQKAETRYLQEQERLKSEFESTVRSGRSRLSRSTFRATCPRL
jgi:hypothetical protein